MVGLGSLLLVVTHTWHVLGEACLATGTVFRQLGETRFLMEENVKEKLLDPLQNLQDKTLDEISVC